MPMVAVQEEETMRLLDIVYRAVSPAPWSEGEGLPYGDPGFGTRLLERLTDSRRIERIDSEVRWIHHKVLDGRPTRILELCCGAGLHLSRLARLGHECVGIDFAPAFIAHAADVAKEEELNCTYLQEDVRTAEYGSEFGLVMLIGAEFNNFRPESAQNILRKSRNASSSDGILVLDVGRFEAMKREGEEGPRWAPPWYAAPSGSFSDQPHLCLNENLWDPGRCVYTERHFVIDAATGDVTRYASSAQAYTDEQYRSLLDECGFTGITFFPSLTGEQPPEEYWMQFVIVARKKAAAPMN